MSLSISRPCISQPHLSQSLISPIEPKKVARFPLPFWVRPGHKEISALQCLIGVLKPPHSTESCLILGRRSCAQRPTRIWRDGPGGFPRSSTTEHTHLPIPLQGHGHPCFTEPTHKIRPFPPLYLWVLALKASVSHKTMIKSMCYAPHGEAKLFISPTSYFCLIGEDDTQK